MWIDINNHVNEWNKKQINNMQSDTTKWLVKDILKFVDEYKPLIPLIPWFVLMWVLDNQLIWTATLLLWFLWWEKWEKISDITKKKTVLENILNNNTDDILLMDYITALKTIDKLLEQWIKWISTSFNKIRSLPQWIFPEGESNGRKIREEHNEENLKIFFENTVKAELKIIISKIDENKFRV